MATITTNVTLSYSGSTETLTLSGSLSATQSGTGYLAHTQSIGTSAEALDLGDLADVGGGLLIKNTDDTNFVEIDSVNTFDNFPQKILPGATLLLCPQTTTIYVKANTGAVSISILASPV